MKKTVGLLIPVLLIIISCSPRINPEKPSFTVDDSQLDSLPNSEINIPIQVNLKPVYTMAEKSVDTLFTSPNYPDEWLYEGCDVRYKYSFRRSPLQIKASGTVLDLGFTGYYKIIGSTRVCVNGTAMSPWTPPCRCGFNEPERKVKVSFSNSVFVLPDYKVRLNFKRNEPEPLDKCEVCFWGTDITKQVIKGLKLELDAAKTNLDASYGMIDLRPKFLQVWDQLNKAYDLHGMGWLQINPRQFRLNNLFARNDSLLIFLGLTARPVIRFEKSVTPPQSMPNMGSMAGYSGFSIFLDAVLNYDSLTNILNRQLAGKQFEFDKGPVKKTFIIDECRLYGSGSDKFIIRVKFSGTNSGTVYLIGKPVYDNSTQVIEIKDIDFDIRSKNALLKAADWLFNKRISSEIAKQTRFELASYIDTARVNINRQLNREWVKGIRSYGLMNELRLIGIFPAKEALIIRSNCTGELSIKVESIDFSL